MNGDKNLYLIYNAKTTVTVWANGYLGETSYNNFVSITINKGTTINLDNYAKIVSGYTYQYATYKKV